MHKAGRTHKKKSGLQERAIESESKSLLYTIFHASPTPISISRLSDGQLVEVNEEWGSFTGYGVSDSIGKALDEIGLWKDEDRYAEIVAELDGGESLHDQELTLRTRTDELRTVIVSMQRITVEGEQCLLTVMNDITEHKRTLQALKESEERFRMLADSAPVLIWLTDESRAGTYFNKSWLEFTGAEIAESIGEGWMTFVHPDDLDRLLRIYGRSFEGRTPFRVEYRLHRHDGEYRWVIDRGVPRYRPDGTFAGFVGSVLDINEQKDTEQKLLEAKEYAEEMSKLKTSFLTNITHEIRTPLTVILGFTSILRQGVRSEYQRFINLIERSGRRLLLMLDSMLDLAQLEAGTLEMDERSQNVLEVVESAVESIRPVAEEKGLDIQIKFPGERRLARFDHAILTRIINNLLDNAIKFTDEGYVSVEVRGRKDTVEVVVRDTGIGIEEQFLHHVFDPFVQESTGLDRTHQGSGLGLSVSKRLLERMGGSITLSSTKGEGSVFTIILPGSN